MNDNVFAVFIIGLAGMMVAVGIIFTVLAFVA